MIKNDYIYDNRSCTFIEIIIDLYVYRSRSIFKQANQPTILFKTYQTKNKKEN